MTQAGKNQTAKTAREKVNRQTDVTHITELCKTLVALPFFVQVKIDLLNMSDEKVRATCMEIILCYVLTLEILLSSGGKRPSTLSYMLNIEIDLDDGSIVVEAENHKLDHAEFVLLQRLQIYG